MPERNSTDPRRIVTSTVPVAGGNLPVVSVNNGIRYSEGKIRECLCALKGVGLDCTGPNR